MTLRAERYQRRCQSRGLEGVQDLRGSPALGFSSVLKMRGVRRPGRLVWARGASRVLESWIAGKSPCSC
jgi:hypothetical protein